VRLITPVVTTTSVIPSSFASLNTGLLTFTWKMAVKTEREIERQRERENSDAVSELSILIYRLYFVQFKMQSNL